MLLVLVSSFFSSKEEKGGTSQAVFLPRLFVYRPGDTHKGPWNSRNGPNLPQERGKRRILTLLLSILWSTPGKHSNKGGSYSDLTLVRSLLLGKDSESVLLDFLCSLKSGKCLLEKSIALVQIFHLKFWIFLEKFN